jgi:hypothetical protein
VRQCLCRRRNAAHAGRLPRTLSANTSKASKPYQVGCSSGYYGVRPEGAASRRAAPHLRAIARAPRHAPGTDEPTSVPKVLLAAAAQSAGSDATSARHNCKRSRPGRPQRRCSARHSGCVLGRRLRGRSAEDPSWAGEISMLPTLPLPVPSCSEVRPKGAATRE